MAMSLGEHYDFFRKYIKHTVDLIRGFYWLAITINDKRSLWVEWYTVWCRSYYVDNVVVENGSVILFKSSRDCNE